MAAPSSQIVVLLGAGPGLGLACARLFAQKGHPVALLSRSKDRLETLSAQINAEIGDQGRTRPYAVDVTKGDDVQRVFASIAADWQDRASIHTAIFNAGGLFKRLPFLDTTEADLRRTIDTQVIGGLHFSQAFIRALQQKPAWAQWQADPTIAAPVGNLLFTGATAATRGGANMATLATSSFAMRALSQSIAREFMPQGVHVSHFIVDGIINTEAIKSVAGQSFEPNSRVEPDDVAQIYYDTTQQRRSAWTFETDLRPAKETW